MSALDELIANVKTANKGLLPHYKWQNNNTGINLAYNMTSQQVTEAAERDLSALRERVEAAEALVKEADVLFNQESELCDDPDTEAWIWKWRVRYYFEETDIPPHAMPEDMKA